jgi:hypothetical protein
LVTLTLQTYGCDTIYVAAVKMVELQKKLDVVISGDFNGIEITAFGWNTADEIVAEYERDFTERASLVGKGGQS